MTHTEESSNRALLKLFFAGKGIIKTDYCIEGCLGIIAACFLEISVRGPGLFVPGETSAFFVSIVDKLIKPTKLLLPSQYGIAHLEEGVFTERKGEPKKLGQCSNF